MRFQNHRLSLNKTERLRLYRMIEWLKEMHCQHMRLGMPDDDTAQDAWIAAMALESLLQATDSQVIKLRSWAKRI